MINDLYEVKWERKYYLGEHVPVGIVHPPERQGLGKDHLLVYISELDLNVLAPRRINAVMTLHK